ncbi:MAG: flagellar biosynthetic protein FliO [Acidimicrobiales bacterium]
MPPSSSLPAGADRATSPATTAPGSRSTVAGHATPAAPAALKHPAATHAATHAGATHTATAHGAAKHAAATHAHAAATHLATGAQSVSASSLLVQMAVGLVVIVLLIKMVSKLVQGRGARAFGHAARPQGLAVVGRQSLGKGVQVAMVSTGAQTYLLGVTTQQVTLLGEVGVPAAATGDEGTNGTLQLLPGATAPALAAGASGTGWKAALEQMRDRTARRA